MAHPSAAARHPPRPTPHLDSVAHSSRRRLCGDTARFPDLHTHLAHLSSPALTRSGLTCLDLCAAAFLRLMYCDSFFLPSLHRYHVLAVPVPFASCCIILPRRCALCTAS